MTNEQIAAMQKAFTVSVAVFEAAHTISGIFATVKPHKSLMHKLHILTLSELNKDEPDFGQLDRYLMTMEEIAELNAHEQKSKENEQKKI